MANLALITGASVGIGRELARYHAAKGGDLIITARRKKELDALKQELEEKHSVKVYVVVADLGKEETAEKLLKFVKTKNLKVDILINNAGFGGHGVHIERDLNTEMAMINLNIKSLVALTHKFGNHMVDNGGGKILNVGSTVGFMPGPLQAVYFATKAFVNSFSQAIDQELRAKGVTCTVLAPGPVETEFVETAKLDGIAFLEKGGARADDVAKLGYDAMMKGKLVTINEKLLGFALTWIVPLAPRRLVLKNVQKMQTK